MAPAGVYAELMPVIILPLYRLALDSREIDDAGVVSSGLSTRASAGMSAANKTARTDTEARLELRESSG